MMPPLPPTGTVQALLEERIQQNKAVGLIVGLIDSDGPRIIAAGASGNSARPKVDELTLFELGSVTKLFTTAVLADAVVRGRVTLDDPVCKFLVLPPDGIGNRTLKELATHTSGLPRLPSGFTWWSNLLLHPRNPYANYSQRDLETYLVTLKDKGFPRGAFAYSNLGAALLANALAARCKSDYAGLIARRVTQPLGMSRTFLQIPAHEEKFVAQPHSRSLRPTAVWTMASLAGAGGLLSSIHDMLLFASAALARTAPLYASMLQPLARAGAHGREVALGWMLRTSDTYRVAWHNGGTGGSRSFLALDLENLRASVVLSNTAHTVDQLAVQLLLGPEHSSNFF
jgi:serine-type D-Ala-D-Ala carboxypeptidase/endopeptidase